MSHLARLLGYPRTKPVTISEVSAAKPDPEQEKRVKRATGELVGNIMAVERTAFDVREAIAAGALKLVGDTQR